MDIGYYREGCWEELNSSITQIINEKYQLSLEPNACEVYNGVQHALLEIVLGLGRQFPFKKRILYTEQLDPFIDSCVVEFSKIGFKLEALGEIELSHLESAIAPGAKDILCVLYPAGDAILGKKYNMSVLRNLLAERRQLGIKLSYIGDLASSEFRLSSEFEVLIQSMTKKITVVTRGERARYTSLMAPHFYWEQDIVSNIQELLSRKFIEDQGVVNKFEADSAGSWKCFFSSDNTNRYYDRAVIYWEDMDGLALIDELARTLPCPLEPDSSDPVLETASLSRWGGLDTMNWLTGSNQSISINGARGLVIIDISLVNESLREKLEEARSKVLQRQGLT